jgi:WD40 repeat protein
VAERLLKGVRWRPALVAFVLASIVAASALVVAAVSSLYNCELRDARQAEQKARAAAQRILYFHTVRLTEEFWWRSVAGTQQLLESCPEKWRGRGWHYLNRLGRTDLPTLPGHEDETTCAVVSSDGSSIASGSRDHSVKIWDVASGRTRFQTLAAHVGLVWGVAFSPVGARLATVSGELFAPSEVKVWDTATATHRLSIPQDRGVFQVCFSPDGRRLAGAIPHARCVKVWDAGSGSEILGLEQGKSHPWAVSFSPDGQLLASVGNDQTVRLWDANTGRLIQTLRGTQ